MTWIALELDLVRIQRHQNVDRVLNSKQIEQQSCVAFRRVPKMSKAEFVALPTPKIHQPKSITKWRHTEAKAFSQVLISRVVFDDGPERRR